MELAAVAVADTFAEVVVHIAVHDPNDFAEVGEVPAVVGEVGPPSPAESSFAFPSPAPASSA